MAFDFPNAPVLDQVYAQGGVSYVWNGYAWAAGSGGSAAAADYVLKAGDTMTGPLILSEHPTAVSPALQAATKGFVASISLPIGGVEGQALTINVAGIATWGAPIVAANF